MITNYRRLATVLVGGLAVLTLAACGSNTTASGGGGQNAPSGGSSAQPGGGGTGGGGFPGVSGLIVARSGKTMQVRTVSGQSAVSYTDKTTVTEEKAATAAAAKVGMCATVRSTESASPGSTPSTSITARAVGLTQPVNGSCRGGFAGPGRFGGNRPSGMPSGGTGGQPGQFPSGVPGNGAPSGTPGGGRFGFGGASGVITAVSGTTLTIEETRGNSDKTNVTVTLTHSTTYTQQAKSSTDAIATGKCVLATGKTDSTGAMAATALRLSAAVDGSCTFGGGRRQGAPSGGQSGG